jgi:TolB-like protein/class 3 adenylate cyclase/Tfp pilus assembly protein PilF
VSTEVKKEIELEIAYVLFIDIVGYSKLLIDQQRRLLELLNEIVRGTDQFQKAEANHRLITIPTGDGMALVFYNTPEAPVECALEISRAVKAHPELPLRMGVHSGPVSGVVDVSGRANIAGAGINIAQRVMDCGDAEHILLSKHVAEDLEQLGHWKKHLHDLGEAEVKHGSRVSVVNLYTEELGNPEVPQKFLQARHRPAAVVPMAVEKSGRSRNWMIAVAAIVLIAGLAGSGYLFSRRSPQVGGEGRAVQPTITTERHIGGASPPTPAAIPEKSIAVMPFENLSSDKDNAYFADGIQDEILTRLSKIADLKVISRTSTQHYKSAPENLPEIARQLGVAHILEGSVQKAGNAVHINVQLIKAASDAHLWGESYDRELQNIFGVEAEVAKAIADQLRARLTGQEEQIITAKPTDNTAAYDAYLRGLGYNLRSTASPANSLGAQKHLREAVRLDPKFALAWALLSYVEARGYRTLNLQPTVALREETRQAAETALTLQPNLGEAVHAKGYYHYSCLKDYDTAVRYFEQARPLLPNSSQIPYSLALVERRRGQWERSESYFNDAERLDPRNVGLLTQHALLYNALRRFPEALRKFDQVLNIIPDDMDTLVLKAAIAQAEGDLPRAAALLAPLRPAADDAGALETQVYQSILERNPGPIIPRLKEMLAKPDPALGYFIGELRFWLGWAQEVAGDHAGAQESWKQARSELEPFLKEQPDNWQLIADLALTNMNIGDKAAAFAFVEKGMVVVPIEKDAYDGPGPTETLARVSAQMGEPDRALAALEKVLSIPYEAPLAFNLPLTPALLRLDSMFDPLRNDPRFQKLAASSVPKTADK